MEWSCFFFSQASRLIAQIIVMGGQMIGKSIAQAWKQAAQGLLFSWVFCWFGAVDQWLVMVLSLVECVS
jgi:hypothetical protein